MINDQKNTFSFIIFQPVQSTCSNSQVYAREQRHKGGGREERK